MLPTIRYRSSLRCGQRPGEEVWGVIFSLSKADLLEMDGHEGYNPNRTKNSYLRETIQVEGEDGLVRGVWAYIAVPDGKGEKPNRDYVVLICKGARENGLPAEYCERLEAFLATLD